MRNVKIGLIQTKASDDVDANIDNTAERVYAAAKDGAQIICLPELYRTKYFPQYKRDFTHLAETIPGPSTNLFSGIAEKVEAVIIVPIYERAKGGKFYNSAAIINSDGKLLGAQHKIHIPSDLEYFRERPHFSAGDDIQIFQTEYGDIAVPTCFDQWFPEVSRICTLKGADVIFYPTAIGDVICSSPPEGSCLEPWEIVQRGQSAANAIPIAAVNRVGVEGEIDFFGNSFICDFGKILAKASRDNEEIVLADVDLDKSSETRKAWGFVDALRPDFYANFYGAYASKLEPKKI